MNIEVTDKIKEEDKEIIYQGLLSYNLARIEDKNLRDLVTLLFYENFVNGFLNGNVKIMGKGESILEEHLQNRISFRKQRGITA